MQLRHRLYEAKAKAVARRTSALLEAIETAKYPVSFGGGNARSVIGHRQMDSAGGVALDRDFDIAPAMLHGVINQVGKRFEEEVAIAEHQDTFGAAKADARTALLRGRVIEIGHLRGDARQIH